MDLLVVAVVDEAVVRALDDREAEVERIAHREQALALRHRAGDRALVEFEERRHGLVEADDGKVVDDVDRLQGEGPARAVRRDVLQPIG